MGFGVRNVLLALVCIAGCGDPATPPALGGFADATLDAGIADAIEPLDVGFDAPIVTALRVEPPSVGKGQTVVVRFDVDQRHGAVSCRVDRNNTACTTTDTQPPYSYACPYTATGLEIPNRTTIARPVDVRVAGTDGRVVTAQTVITFDFAPPVIDPARTTVRLEPSQSNLQRSPTAATIGTAIIVDISSDEPLFAAQVRTSPIQLQFSATAANTYRHVIAGPNIAQGNFRFEIIAMDEAANTSTTMIDATVLIDTIAPSAPMRALIADVSDASQAATSTRSLVGDAGAVEAFALIVAFDDTSEVGRIEADVDGAFVLEPTRAVTLLTAVDRAGNRSPSVAPGRLEHVAMTMAPHRFATTLAGRPASPTDPSLTEPTNASKLDAQDGVSFRLAARPGWGSYPGPPPVLTPPNRTRHATAYFETDARLMMFGGLSSDNGAVALDDAWAFDAAGWTRTSSGPPARFDHTMVYDAARDQLVLFGGDDGTNALGDTWVFDGARWTAITTPGPPARAQTAMAYDPLRQRVVLFGGRADGGTALFDTWEFDGAAWTRVVEATFRPSGRFGHAMSFDGVNGRVFLFGGVQQGGLHSNEAWVWTGTDWSPLPVAGRPPARRALGLARDAARNLVVLCGGYGAQTNYRDVWTWDGITWRTVATSTAGPTAERGSLTYDPDRGELVLVQTDGDSSTQLEVWSFDSPNWIDRTPARPPPSPPSRRGSAGAWDPARGRYVLFGGVIEGDGTRDTWEWDGTRWYHVTPTGPSPTARSGHAMATDSVQGVLLFGGVSAGSSTRLADTWRWDGQSWQLLTFAPIALAGHAMTLDEARGVVVAFGGGTTATQLEFDSNVWRTLALGVAPSPRSHAAMTWDGEQRRVVLFGGIAPGGTELQDTWVYAPTGWRRIATPIAPPARHDLGLVFDLSDGEVWLYGGQTGGTSLGDLWSFDGSTWRERSIAGRSPIARADHVMGLAGGDWLVHGGTADPPTSRTFVVRRITTDRPAMVYSLDTTVVGAGTDRLVLELWTGGTAGVQVSTWNPLQLVWEPVASHPADIDAPDRVEIQMAPAATVTHFLIEPGQPRALAVDHLRARLIRDVP